MKNVGFYFRTEKIYDKIIKGWNRWELLFYKKLRSLVSIELKLEEFEAEYAGKMQLYLTGLGEQVKLLEENLSIGIIICKSKDKTFVKCALKQSNVPIGAEPIS